MQQTDKVHIDIIILSYAKNEHLKALTIQTVDTLMRSEDPEKIAFNVIVMESDKKLQPYQYANTTTVYPKEKFGFHKYLNIGIRMTSSPYVCLCNNDLIFHKNWASEILNIMNNDGSILSASPVEPHFVADSKTATVDLSEKEGFYGVLFGWCIFAKRKLFDITGLPDEKLVYYYSDYDYIYTLKKHGLINPLVLSSKVTHLGGQSQSDFNNSEYINLTQLPRVYFNYKWRHKNYIKYIAELLYYKIRLIKGLKP